MRLADHGLRGNGHMVMLEKNNLQVADFITKLMETWPMTQPSCRSHGGAVASAVSTILPLVSLASRGQHLHRYPSFSSLKRSRSS